MKSSERINVIDYFVYKNQGLNRELFGVFYKKKPSGVRAET